MLVRLAFRNLFRNRNRSLITLAAIALGSIAIIVAGGFIEDLLSQAQERSIGEFLGHLRIYRQGYRDEGALHPFDYMISDPDALIKKLKIIPHVLHCAPRLSFAGLLSSGDATISFMGEGVDVEQDASLRRGLRIEQGRFFDGSSGYQVLLGKGLARAMKVPVGTPLVMLSNTLRGGMNATDVSVMGIFETVSRAFDDRTARIPLTLAKTLLRTEDVQTIILFLDDTVHTDSVKKQVEHLIKVSGLNYEVRAWYEMEDAEDILKMRKFDSSLFRVFQLLMVFVVILGVFNTLNMSVLERVGEIGTMMALGMRQSDIRRLFILEGLIMGVAGGAVGVLGGILCAMVISRVGIPLPSAPFTTTVFIARIALVPSAVASAAVLAFATTFFSSVFPAMKASRLEIAEALRHNI